MPDAFFREWIRSHYSDCLLEVTKEVIGRSVSLSIEIYDEAVLPASDVVVQTSTYSNVDPKRDQPASITIPLPSESEVPFTFPGAPTELPETSDRTKALRSQSPDPLPSPKRIQPKQNSTILSSSASSSRIVRRLEDFVTGASNQLAHAAAREMARSAGCSFNPLVIHGGVGLGKTHLLEGIAHALRQSRPNLHVAQFTAETFTNSFLDAMRTGSLTGFRTRYRSVGGLIVDDVHFLAAKKATQDEFLHTFNALFDKGGAYRVGR